MYHGILYDSAGRVIEIPGQDGRIPRNLRLRAYPVVERHGLIWIWMGDSADPDETLIPPLLGLDRSDYHSVYGQLDYAAEARLVNDNLLDLSHVSYLHETSLQVGETWARERPNITVHARGVRSERWIRNQGELGHTRSDHRVDTYVLWEAYIPGVYLMTSRTYPVGTADRLQGAEPDLIQRPPGHFASHAVTPLTQKTSRYVYINGALRAEHAAKPDQAALERVFGEDRAMIEAQQRNLDSAPGHRFKSTPADEAVIQFNRLVEKLTQEEAAPLLATKDAPPSPAEVTHRCSRTSS
jgi:vanillate O-demethylase monooxygenase subunit